MVARLRLIASACIRLHPLVHSSASIRFMQFLWAFMHALTQTMRSQRSREASGAAPLHPACRAQIA